MQEDGPGGEKTWGDVLAGEFLRNKRLFYKLAFDVVRNHATAEEVCQQAFVIAMESEAKVRDRRKVRPWLAKTVFHEALQVARRRRTEQKVLTREANRAREADDAPSPGDRMALLEAIVTAMEELTDEQGLIVALRAMQQMSGNAVAGFLGYSASDVSKALHEGLDRLRPQLADWDRRQHET